MSVDAVLVKGRIVKWDGRLIGIDLDEARRRVQESHDYLLGAVNWPYAAVDFTEPPVRGRIRSIVAT